MKYTVIWTVGAETELTRSWLSAPNRQAVTAAARQIDLLLQYNPHQVGASRSGDERIVIAPPLSARFYVQEDDRKVIVFQVWRFEQRSSN